MTEDIKMLKVNTQTQYLVNRYKTRKTAYT